MVHRTRLWEVHDLLFDDVLVQADDYVDKGLYTVMPVVYDDQFR